MDPIIQFIAFGLWTFVCIGFGAVMGYFLRYTMENKNTKPICYGSQGKCSGKGIPQGQKGSKPAPRGATPPPRDTTDGDLDSNMGFEVMSDGPAPERRVPQTTMPPPPAHEEPIPRSRRGHFTERGPNIPMYYTDTYGTRIHARRDCPGLRDVEHDGRRVKEIEVKKTCSWCCGGVLVIP